MQEESMVRVYRLGLYEKAMPDSLDWEEKLLTAKHAGYDFIEMSVDETDEKLARLDMSIDDRRALVDLTLRVQMPIRSMCLSGHRRFPLGSHDRATVARSLEILSKAVKLAADLGIRLIQLAGYDVYYEDSDDFSRNAFTDNLTAAVEMATAEGVILGFETMETEFMNTVGKAMSFVSAQESPYLGIYPDIGNLTNAAVLYGTDVISDLVLGRGRLFAMHLKETVPGVFREVPFGAGHVDFDCAIDAAWNLGVRMFVTEFWYKGESDWRERLYQTNELFRKKLDMKDKKRI